MIEIEGLCKDYKDAKGKPVAAITDITFQCQPGKVFGLLGPNGAGKTTTLRIISTALKPTRGRGTVQGVDIVRDAAGVRRNIGFLSSNTGLYGRLTPREILRYFGDLFGLDRARIARRTDELAQRFAMGDFLDKPCDKLSTGMRQKVNIARTVLHDPPVMVFDEPTAGLDVLTSRIIVQFIGSCRTEGKTILFSTHIMSEVEKLCDQVAVIHKGRLHHAGNVSEMRQQYGDNLEDAFVRIVNIREGEE